MVALRGHLFFAFLVAVFSGKAVIGAPPPYTATWGSLDTRPLPQWYDDAKIGILLHWGVYSVPSYGNEWFWSNWKVSGLPDYVTFVKNYYKPGFTYQEFAKDFRAEIFEPPKWAKLFQDSGAKYVVLTSKHHDGYTLWPSSRSISWNSKDVGPHRDLIQELSVAVRASNIMKFGLHYSLYEWFNPLYMADKATGYKQQKYVVDKVHPELYELVNKYKPDILWSDGEWEASAEYWKSTEFVAWLYNTSPVRQTVVTNDRWGKDTKCAHGGFLTCSEDYNPGVLQKRKWENAFSLDKTSWGHRGDATLKNYVSSEELIKKLVTTISCGGNALINVGPTSHGTIQPIFEERLLDMGAWLKLNGEAIYASKPWILQKDPKTPNVWYTQKSATPGRTNVYAMVVEYPYATNGIDLYGLARRLDNTSTVSLLGYPKPLVWKENFDSLHIQFPDKNLIDQIGLKYTWIFKINVPID